MKRMVVLVVLVVVACKGKSNEKPAPAPAPGSASAAVAVAPPAIDAAPAAPALPTASTRNGPWGLDVKAKQTVQQVAATGYALEDNVSNDRMMKAGFISTTPGAKVGVRAHYAPEGSDKSVTLYETNSGPEIGNDERRAAFEKAGLCVEGLCPGMPIDAIRALKIEKCQAFTVEMDWWYECLVPDSPLVIVGHGGEVAGVKNAAKISLDKLVAGKVEIFALAWGEWTPIVGCTTDCD